MVNLDKLKEIVKNRGCSMAWISQNTGIPYRRVIDLFSGRIRWTVDDARKIASVLEINAKDRHFIFF